MRLSIHLLFHWHSLRGSDLSSFSHLDDALVVLPGQDRERVGHDAVLAEPPLQSASANAAANHACGGGALPGTERKTLHCQRALVGIRRNLVLFFMQTQVATGAVDGVFYVF